MTAARAKAPTLAWLLMALTCLLTGMALVESRHQTVVLPVFVPDGAEATIAVAVAPTTTPAPALGPPTPIPDAPDRLASPEIPRVEVVLVPPEGDPAVLRVDRHTIPPGGSLPSEEVPGPTLLLIEAGSLAMQIDGARQIGQGLDAGWTNTVLDAGERLIVAAGDRYALRNGGPTPAEALVVTILPPRVPTA